MKNPFSGNMALKWVVFLFMAWVAVRGAQRTPEIASRLDPGTFYDALVNDGANAAIMKERHVDFIDETLRALNLRRSSDLSRPDFPAAGSLVTPASLARARERETARWYRESVNFEQARQNLERQRAFAANKPAEPVCCRPAQGAQSAPGGARP